MNEAEAVGTAVARRPGDTWRPVDLAAVVAFGYQPPRPDVCMVTGSEFGLLYSGRINAIFGDSGGGKTWVALWAIKEVVESGRYAVLIDYEDHPAATVQRLENLGCSRANILQYLVYVQPQERWDARAERVLLESLAGRQVAVAVIDSTGEGMALDGVNPNADDEVARWFRGAARTLAAQGAAVGLIDHVPKEQQGGRNVAFASGSQRKRAAVNGAAYFLDVLSAPSRDADGAFKLITRKCRFGWRKHGSVACVIEMRNGEGGAIEFTIKEQEASASARFRPTWTMEKMSKWLETVAQPVSWRQAREAPVGKQGGKAKRELVDTALAVLRDEGYISWPKGQPIEHVRPYFEAIDEEGDETVGGVSPDPF